MATFSLPQGGRCRKVLSTVTIALFYTFACNVVIHGFKKPISNAIIKANLLQLFKMILF